MQKSALLKIRKELGKTPVLDAEIGGPIPMFVERYLYQATELFVSGIPFIGLIIVFGGSTAREGESDQMRSTLMPTQSMLVPPNTSTHWHYSGAVDYAVYYFRETESHLVHALYALVAGRKDPMSFSDALVGAAGRQILDQLHKGGGADQALIELLVQVISRQTYHALTASAVGGINPRHVQYSRLQAVLNHIRSNLSADLSIGKLSQIAGVEESYFRRIFHDATGMGPHDYVMTVRLEQARQLLSMSEVPIAQIANDCGFANQSHLTSRFRAAHAVTPADFRKRTVRA